MKHGSFTTEGNLVQEKYYCFNNIVRNPEWELLETYLVQRLDLWIQLNFGHHANKQLIQTRMSAVTHWSNRNRRRRAACNKMKAVQRPQDSPDCYTSTSGLFVAIPPTMYSCKIKKDRKNRKEENNGQPTPQKKHKTKTKTKTKNKAHTKHKKKKNNKYGV